MPREGYNDGGGVEEQNTETYLMKVVMMGLDEEQNTETYLRKVVMMGVVKSRSGS